MKHSIKVEEEEINSVSEFITKITQLEKDETEIRYYRGHADKEWSLLPSLFRTPAFTKNEHLLFRDMVAHEPGSFSKCTSVLDYLTQMQHYGLPTRLLDVTTNPHVALYFACESSGTIPDVMKSAFDAGWEAGQYATYEASLSLETGDSSGDAEWYGVWAGAFSGAVAVAGFAPEISIRIIGTVADAISSSMSSEMERDAVKAGAEAGAKAGAEAGAKAGAEAGAKAGPKDGAVYLFSTSEGKVKHYDSDTVSVLANLARCTSEQVDLSLFPPKDLALCFYKQLEANTESSDTSQNKALGRMRSHEEAYRAGAISWLSIEDCCEVQKHMILNPPKLESDYVEWFNGQGGVSYWLPQIKSEKPYFRPLISVSDLASVFFVKAKRDNPRIINQSGAFILFGLCLYAGDELRCGKLVHAEIPKKWIKRKFIVPKGKKKDILEELAQLGITKSYIYPEMEQYAKELKKKYGA